MKKLFKSFEEFQHSINDYNWCEYQEATLEHRSPKFKRVNIWNWVVYNLQYPNRFGKLICKLAKKHHVEMETGGDAESGPITCWYCTRCGKGETIFGM